MSFIDKLGVLLEVSKSSKLYILIIIGLLLLGVFLFTTNRRNLKRNKIIFLAFLGVIALIFLIVYHTSLASMFDYMMNNLFVAIYFPTLAIYFAAIIVTNIILWTSVFNFRTSKIIKRVNIVAYIIMNYLLILILNVVNTERLDVFSQNSIYGNDKATALISLSSIVFMVWIIYLIVYKIILVYIKKDYKPKVKKIIVKRKVKKLPENFEPVISPDMIYKKENFNAFYSSSLKPVNTEYQVTLPLETVEVKHETKKATTAEEVLTKEFDKMFTLDDYKLLLKMLTEQKEKERLASESKVEVATTSVLHEEELRLEREKQEALRQEQLRLEAEKQEALRKEALRLEKEKQEALKLEQLRIEQLKAQELEREQEKLTELEMLYRSIR